MLALLAAVLGYFHASYWGVWRIPGPVAMPFVGNLPLLARYGPGLFSILAKQYGPIFRLEFIYSHFFLDSRWSTMRNTILSVYQPSHLAKLVPTMQEVIESATQNLLSDKEEDIIFSDFSLKLATDMIGQAAFGVDFGLSKPFNDSAHQSNDNVPILQEPFRQILKRIPGTVDWKVEKTNRTLSSRLDEIVAKKMEVKDRESKDFLSLILKARESEAVSRSVFTPDYISAVTYEHLLAGSATTSFTLSSVIYLVAGHPEVEKKLIEEIDGFGPRDQKPNANDLQLKFPYLDQASVVKEAMRFYTVSPLVARETSKEVEIGVPSEAMPVFPETGVVDVQIEGEPELSPYRNSELGLEDERVACPKSGGFAEILVVTLFLLTFTEHGSEDLERLPDLESSSF
ncbi:hypothetical protein C3L33_21778, partial [Rhododendron williamsianum]